MTNKKYISSTLPYINSNAHIGHAFEFVLADIVAEYYRSKLGSENVFLNVGVDEHGQKIYQKSLDEGFENTQDYCDLFFLKWKNFCKTLNIKYDNFYRTTDSKHKENVLKFYNEIKSDIFEKEYEGQYCVGCESFITKKEVVNGKCPIHHTELLDTKETNKFFNLKKFSPLIKDILIDKTISPELINLFNDNFDLSITRQNVKWGIETGTGDVFYVWAEALLNYIFAIKYYEDKNYFNEFWANSLIIAGKDNLKFQAYILQALLLANNIPQTKEVLIHGIILDEKGDKMSKSVGNVIDPIEQVKKYGLDAVRYYLFFGLNTFSDSKYSEADLVKLWNNDIVNGLGNLISRSLHLIDIKKVEISEVFVSQTIKDKIVSNTNNIEKSFEDYNFGEVKNLLNGIIANCNKRITEEKPFDKNCPNYQQILNEIYFEVKNILPYYQIVLKDHSDNISKSFVDNKKIILFDRKEFSEAVTC